MSSKRKQINYDSDEKKKARTPPHTTLSHTNNVMPNVTLDALGLNPVIETPWTGGTTCHPKTSVLKFAVVKELQQYHIFFRFVPGVQPHGNLFWLTQSNLVWADIVGDSKAEEYLLEKLGNTAYQTSVYDQNKDIIHSHFCPNRLPSELNQILGVETQEFHSATQQNSTEPEQHVEEGSHLPIILDTDEEEQL